MNLSKNKKTMKVSELYTGQTATVSNGKVAFPRYENNIAVIAKKNE